MALCETMASGKDALLSEPHEQEEEKVVKIDRFPFLWNSKTKEFLGRSGCSWFKVLLFYVLFFGGLAGFWAGLLHAFYSTLSDVHPTYYGEQSMTQNNPGLGFRPMPQYDTTLVRFEQARPSSYRVYTDHLEAFFNTYRNVSGDNVVKCDGTAKAPEGKICQVDPDSILAGSKCTKSDAYGFQAGQPCFAIKMNKIFGFVPEPYTDRAALDQDYNQTEPDEPAPPPLRFLSFSDNNGIGISCDGQNEVDRSNIKEIKFYPTTGLSQVFYPYENQPNYRSPFVMAQFADVTKRVTIQVACKLFAANIDNSDGQKKHGTLHFELFIE